MKPVSLLSIRRTPPNTTSFPGLLFAKEGTEKSPGNELVHKTDKWNASVEEDGISMETARELSLMEQMRP